MNLDWASGGYFGGKTVITTLDAHAAGEPLRIVTGGLPELVGDTILERRRYMRDNLDHVRRAIMWEPRGHYNMYGAVLTPPVSPGAHLGVLFLHNEGYSTMCGHGVIALVTALLESGAFPAAGRETPVNLDTPAGLVRATAHLDDAGHVAQVSFLNVPSFRYAADVQLTLPGIGAITVDIGFGGAFYAYLPAARVGLQVAPEHTAELVAVAEAIKREVNRVLPIRHPLEEDLSFLYGVILSGPPEDPAHTIRNICVFANAEVDRSPTGTGVSGHVALLHARDLLPLDGRITVESILGAASVFAGRVAGQTHVGDFDAVIPEVSGAAYITGRHEFVIDPADTLGNGFLLP